MTNEELQAKLYQQMSTEQERYRDWLLGQPPDEILRHASEYTVRSDILYALDGLELTDKQIKSLIKSPCPLADIFKAWQNCDAGYIDDLRDVIKDRADTVIRTENEKKPNRREER